MFAVLLVSLFFSTGYCKERTVIHKKIAPSKTDIYITKLMQLMQKNEVT